MAAGAGPQLPPNSSGFTLAAFNYGSGPTLYLPASCLTDSAGNELVSATSAPAGTERALIVRNIPSGTQTVSGSVTTSGTATITGNKAEDAPAADADAGLPILGVRNDAAAVRTSLDGDYGMVALDSAGRIGVADLGGAISVDDNAGSLTVDAPVATPLFARLSDGAAALAGQKTMANSLPIVVASDQSNVPTNIAAVGGSALSAKISAQGQNAIPVWPNAVQRDTYSVTMNGIALAVTAGGGDKILFSLEHAGASTKTVRIRRVLVSGVVTTASAAVVGNLRLNIFKGTAASSAGTGVTPTPNNAASPAAEVSVKHTPTIVATTGPLASAMVLATGSGGATVGTLLNVASPILLYDSEINEEAVPITLRSANLESVVIAANGSWATTAPTITWGITVILTEE
jgi:hypothetical protein